MKELRLSVEGMTCSSCEVLLERKLRKVEGVYSASVSLDSRSAVIECAEHVSVADLNAVLEGYSLQSAGESHFADDPPSPDVFRVSKRHLEVFAAIAIVAGLWWVFSTLDLVPDIGVSDSMSYGFIFILGLVASLSTCLAVAGGLLLAIAAKHLEAYPNLNGWAKFRPHAFFNVGRIVGYTVLGGLVGLLGSAVSLSPFMTGILTVLAGVMMVLVGVQLLGIMPALGRFQIKMPKVVAHRIYDSSTSAGPSGLRSFGFGAATFFLPCGFTQALQLYVLASADPVKGALTMLAFSMGTAPALISIGAISSVVSGTARRYFSTFAAVLVIVLGVFAIPSGAQLVGLMPVSLDNSISGAAVGNQGEQVVRMRVEGLDYFPHQFNVKAGVPVKWYVDGTAAAGCARVLTSPGLNINTRLNSAGETLIEFTPDRVGFVPFQCAMGMTTRGAGFNVVA